MVWLSVLALPADNTLSLWEDAAALLMVLVAVASGPKDGSIQGLEVEMKTTNPQDAECLKTMSLPSVFSSQGGS